MKSTAKVGLGVWRLLGTETAQPCLGLQTSLWMAENCLLGSSSLALLCYCCLAPCVVNGAS